MERLRILREAKALNQQGLAMKLNISRSSVSYYETGERTPDLEMLIQLSEFFDVSIDYLVGRSSIKRANLHEEQNADDVNFYHDYLRLTPTQKSNVAAFVQGMLTQEKK
jgi:transcriptional regulator with XRE-family HTH domain